MSALLFRAPRTAVDRQVEDARHLAAIVFDGQGFVLADFYAVRTDGGDPGDEDEGTPIPNDRIRFYAHARPRVSVLHSIVISGSVVL